MKKIKKVIGGIILIVMGILPAALLLPDTIRVTFSDKPEKTYIHSILNQTAGKGPLELKGHFNFDRTRVLVEIPRDKRMGRWLFDKEYYYPFFDGSSDKGIYVVTMTSPDSMIERYKDEAEVTGIWRKVSKKHRLEHKVIDVSERAQRLTGKINELTVLNRDYLEDDPMDFTSVKTGKYSKDIESGIDKFNSEYKQVFRNGYLRIDLDEYRPKGVDWFLYVLVIIMALYIPFIGLIYMHSAWSDSNHNEGDD